jgi:hypothetical protein
MRNLLHLFIFGGKRGTLNGKGIQILTQWYVQRYFYFIFACTSNLDGIEKQI